VHGHAADVLTDQLTLTRVHPHADLDPKRAGGLRDPKRAAQAVRGRAVEGRHEAVADGLHLASAEAGERLAHVLVVAG